MKKRIIAVMLVIGVMLMMLVAFTGCQAGESSSSMTITSLEGAGSRTYTFKIAADKEPIENDPDENGVVTYQVFNNSTYFPKGYQALADYIGGKLGSDYSVTVDDSAVDYVYINLTYTFTNLNDYIAKTKALITEERWTKSKFADPKIYVERVDEVSSGNALSLDTDAGNEGKIRYTFVESKFIATSICMRMAELVACREAVAAGVFAPYGDSKTNKYCVEEDHDTWNLAYPTNILDTTCIRTYKFMDYENYGSDGMIAWYEEDNGQELTEHLPAGVLSLGSKPEWTIPDPAGYTDEKGNGYYQLEIKPEQVVSETIGSTVSQTSEPEENEDTSENTDEDKKQTGSSELPWMLVAIIASVVACVVAGVSVIIVVVVVKKSKNTI